MLITSLDAASPAERCGGLDLDDVVVAINGVAVHEESDFAALLPPEATKLLLIVSKPNAPAPPPPAPSAGGDLIIVIRRPPGEGLGIVAGFDGVDGAFYLEVTDVDAGSPAAHRWWPSSAESRVGRPSVNLCGATGQAAPRPRAAPDEGLLSSSRARGPGAGRAPATRAGRTVSYVPVRCLAQYVSSTVENSIGIAYRNSPV